MSRKREQRHHLDRRAHTLLTSPAAAGPDNEMLDASQVADWLQVSLNFMTYGRAAGYGPEFEQLTVTKVGYRRGAVKAWLHERAKLLETA